jgi:nitrogen fixation/metabolism regulation signal transduction histidine kinase
MLRSEVVRLRGELEQSNAGLKCSLEENRQMREHLDRILDGLPCGVLVAKSDGAISLINPEGRRLLDLARTTERNDSFGSLSSVPGGLRDLLQRARSEPGEQEQCFADESGGERWLDVRHAAVFDAGKNGDDALDRADCVSIFILT